MTEPTKLVDELDALFARATGGPWEMYQTARPRHFEIGPSQRKIVAMMTTDSTEDNDFGYDNARLLQALVNSWPQLRGMAADAARYRWLRDTAHPDNDDGGGLFVGSTEISEGWGKIYTKHHSGKDLDAAIDAALAAGGSRE